MAGGPLYPSSAIPVGNSGALFPAIYSGGGANAAPYEEGLGVQAATLSANATWSLRFILPPQQPTGTWKLALAALANASSGAATFQVSDAVVSGGASPSAATLTTETGAPSSTPSAFCTGSAGTYTCTWGGTNQPTIDQYGIVKIPLSATYAADGIMVMALTFTTGITLAVPSVWVPWLLWE